MPSVKQILARKDSHVLTIGPDASVLEAAVFMNNQQVGALVVLQLGTLVGIITERDVLRRVVAEQRNPAAAKVAEVMTRDVVCCHDRTSMEEAQTIFKQRRIRHLPVVDEGGQLHGIVSIGDLNAWMLDGQEQTIQSLQTYLYADMR